MRIWILGAVALCACTQPPEEPQTPPPQHTADQVAARAGFLLEQVQRADERTAQCEAGKRDLQGALVARGDRIAELQRELNDAKSEVVRLTYDLHQAKLVLSTRTRQVAGAIASSGDCRAAVAKLTEERDACYVREADRGVLTHAAPAGLISQQ